MYSHNVAINLLVACKGIEKIEQVAWNLGFDFLIYGIEFRSRHKGLIQFRAVIRPCVFAGSFGIRQDQGTEPEHIVGNFGFLDTVGLRLEIILCYNEKVFAFHTASEKNVPSDSAHAWFSDWRFELHETVQSF